MMWVCHRLSGVLIFHLVPIFNNISHNMKIIYLLFDVSFQEYSLSSMNYNQRIELPWPTACFEQGKRVKIRFSPVYCLHTFFTVILIGGTAQSSCSLPSPDRDTLYVLFVC